MERRAQRKRHLGRKPARPAGRRPARLAFEVTGLDRRALEALRLELLRLGKPRRFTLAEFRIVEAD